MIIKPLQVLDEILVECENLPDIAAKLTALRIWHLNEAQIKSATTLVVASRQPAFEDTPKPSFLALEIVEAEDAYRNSKRGNNETDTQWRRRRDRLRHKVRRLEERAERDALPPLVKPKAKKDKWQFKGIGSTVQCPHCNAPSGTKCRNMTGGGAYSKVAKPHVPANSSHKRRKEAEQAANTRAEADSIQPLIKPSMTDEEARDIMNAPYPELEIEPPYSVMNV